MQRLSTLSNPTGIIDLERQRISIALDESNGRRAFSLIRLDLNELDLPSPLNVVVIARRGSTEERIELGPVSDWKKGFQTLAEIGEDGSWAFRILLVQPQSPRLIAVAENVRPEGQGESSSFIALEPADLGQRPWEIELLELEGRAVIRFHKDIYPSAGAAEADRFFMGLLLPEAVRRVAERIAREPALLADDVWKPFKSWLVVHGVDDEPDPDNEDSQNKWCSDVVSAFAERFEFVNQLRELKGKEAEE